MDKPWQRSKAWSPTVRSSAKKSMIVVWLFAGVWNVFAFAMVLSGMGENLLMSLLFPGIGLGLLWYAHHTGKQWRRYGATPLTMDPFPGAIGGHVGGTIDLGSSVGPRAEYDVRLECVYTYYSGSGKNRSRHYDVKWEARGPGSVTTSGSGARLSFRFDVPHGLPASEKPRGDYHLWRLHVEGNQVDVPLRRTFEIGVFPTGERSRHVQVDTTRARAEAVREALEGAMAGLPAAVRQHEDLGLTIEARNDWLRLCLGTGRQKPLAFLFGGIGLVFLGVAFGYADVSALERLIFGVIGSFGLGVGLYLPFNALDVRISPREIQRVRTWLGMVIARQKIRPTQLRSLEIEQGASYYVNDRTTVYYRLEGKGGFGKFRLLESIPDRTLVAGIREQVMKYAGLRLVS